GDGLVDRALEVVRVDAAQDVLGRGAPEAQADDARSLVRGPVDRRGQCSAVAGGAVAGVVAYTGHDQPDVRRAAQEAYTVVLQLVAQAASFRGDDAGHVRAMPVIVIGRADPA